MYSQEDQQRHSESRFCCFLPATSHFLWILPLDCQIYRRKSLPEEKKSKNQIGTSPKVEHIIKTQFFTRQSHSPASSPLMKTCIEWPADITVRRGSRPFFKNCSFESMLTLKSGDRESSSDRGHWFCLNSNTQAAKERLLTLLCTTGSLSDPASCLSAPPIHLLRMIYPSVVSGYPHRRIPKKIRQPESY